MSWVLTSPVTAKPKGKPFATPLARSKSSNTTLDLRCYPKFSPLRSSYVEQRTRGMRAKAAESFTRSEAYSPGTKMGLTSSTSMSTLTPLFGRTISSTAAEDIGTSSLAPGGRTRPQLPILLPHKLDWVQLAYERSPIARKAREEAEAAAKSRPQSRARTPGSTTSMARSVSTPSLVRPPSRELFYGLGRVDREETTLASRLAPTFSDM